YCSNPVVLQPFDPNSAPRPATTGPTAGPAAPSADEAAGRAVLERKCTACHALIDPEETRKSLADWTQTVDRMIGKGAAVNAAERQQLISYLRAVTSRQGR
ncbi:MAG: hypothetical protein HUU35_10125, partial [Armatimonadetes bacterium]|nr:hypothetical protein [Armatimonadota bacterium]